MALLEVYRVRDPLGYQDAWAIQQRWHAARVAGEIPDRLLLLEHRAVYTLGRARLAASHLIDTGQAEVIASDRGGDVTWHGPGQLVGYPILALGDDRHDLHRYLRDVEGLLISTLARLGLKAIRRPDLTGIWVEQRKLASIGIKVSRWVTMHGFALNVDCDLAAFSRIVPCGIEGVEMTSLAHEGCACPPASLERHLLACWQQHLGHSSFVCRELNADELP